MARMHARRKGRSSSKKPLITENPSWVPMKKAEIEEMVIKLATEGNSGAKIGLMLRDQYGVPDIKLATGKSVGQILKDGGVATALPEDLSALLRKVTELNNHLKDNPRDKHNKRSLHLIEAKIRRLERYYKKKEVLPMDWKYTLEGAELELSR